MTDVSITYCKPCGYLKQAKEAEAELKTQLGVKTTLIPGKGGIFTVKVGDKIVVKKGLFSFPSTKQIVTAVAAAVKTSA